MQAEILASIDRSSVRPARHEKPLELWKGKGKVTAPYTHLLPPRTNTCCPSPFISPHKSKKSLCGLGRERESRRH